MTVVTTTADLDRIADAIRVAWAETRSHQVSAWGGYIEIGSRLMEARDAMPANQDYGHWFQEQAFGFTTQWGARLIKLAENAPAVEAALQTAVSHGDEPPGVNALLARIAPSEPRPLRQEDQDDPLDDPSDIVGRDEYGAPLGWVEKETANHLYDFRFEGRFVGLKVPSALTRTRGDQEGRPRESVESEAVRQPISLPFTVAVREEGWPGLIQVAEAVKQAILRDEVLRRDWSRVPGREGGE